MLSRPALLPLPPQDHVKRVAREQIRIDVGLVEAERDRDSALRYPPHRRAEACDAADVP
jgi:hypothetical protein